MQEHSWLKAVESDPFKAFCKVCNTVFQIKSRGIADIIKHQDTKKHKLRQADVAGSKNLTHLLDGK